MTVETQCPTCQGDGVIVLVVEGRFTAHPCRCSTTGACGECDGLGWVESWPQGYRMSTRCGRCGLAQDRAESLSRSGFPVKYLNARLEAPPHWPLLHRWLIEWLTRWEPNGPGLYIHGGVGTGKTYATIAALRKLVTMRHVKGRAPGIRYADFRRLCRELKEGMAHDTTKPRLMRPLRSCSILLLDEVGAGRRTAWEVDILGELIEHRYNHQLTTLYVSNYGPDQLAELLQADDAQFSAHRLVDRMLEVSGQVLEVPATAPNRRRAS